MFEKYEKPTGLDLERDILEFEFRNGKNAPKALLTAKRLGSMRFERGKPNIRRQEVFERFSIDVERVLGMELHHTRNVVVVESDLEAKAIDAIADSLGGADGIVCADSTYVLSITVADCMPIWLRDRKSGVFALLHSGWKGTGILENALDAMIERFGTEPEDVDCILGPHIRSCCYEVDATRAKAFGAEFGAQSLRSRRSPDGRERLYLDLEEANRAIARRRGLGSVTSIPLCTFCDERLGSYRRQGSAEFTRMMALCGYFFTELP